MQYNLSTPTSKAPDRRCQKSLFGHKKMKQRTLGLSQSKIILTSLMNLNKTLRSRKSHRQRGKARGGGEKRKAQKESRKEGRQNREQMRKN